MNLKSSLLWLTPVFALGAVSCARSDSGRAIVPIMSVAGEAEAVNDFVAAQLVTQVPRKLTVAHRGREVVATFALTGYSSEALKSMTRQALDHRLSYSISGISIRS